MKQRDIRIFFVKNNKRKFISVTICDTAKKVRYTAVEASDMQKVNNMLAQKDILLYHGSKEEHFVPTYGKGTTKNDGCVTEYD